MTLAENEGLLQYAFVDGGMNMKRCKTVFVPLNAKVESACSGEYDYNGLVNDHRHKGQLPGEVNADGICAPEGSSGTIPMKQGIPPQPVNDIGVGACTVECCRVENH